MKGVQSSNLQEYATQFWKRQKAKCDDNDRDAIKDIDAGGNPIGWLVNLYPYKLPQPGNDEIRIFTIEASMEMDELLIHHSMIADAWMVERCLICCPKTRRLGDLTSTSLKRGYFETRKPDTQIKIVDEWKSQSSVEGIIENYGMPLLEMTWPDEYEIVDGWGRLHAMSALVKRGLSFKPFNCFVAMRKKQP